jgi:hypothetical protein
MPILTIRLDERSLQKIRRLRLAEELDRSVGKPLDFLTELGVPSPVTFEDYLLGLETLGPGKTHRSRRR